MGVKEIILMIQAMQLLVVALIVIITINSKIVSAITQDSFPFIRNLKLVIKSKQPLFFISLGFLFNWIYLLLNISRNFETFIDENTLQILVVIFNIFNTSCFLLQVLPNLTISANEQSFASHSRSIKAVRDGWKNLSIIFVTVITVVLIIIAFYNWRILEASYYFAVLNLTGFLGITLYLLRLISIHNNKEKVDITRSVIFLGSCIWTILQLLKPTGKLLSIPDDTVNLIGFSGSLLAKFLILYGLYIFINRYTNKQIEEKTNKLGEAYEEIKEKNKELVEKNEQLEENKNQLEQTIVSINSLPDLINSVSNSKDLDELAERTVEHLTSKEVFDFDYAIFSEVNYLKQIINCKAYKKVHDNIIDLGEWVQKDGFPFGHHDIMALLIKDDAQMVHAKGEELNGKPININSPKSPLNRKTYIKYNHQYLNRFFIPLKNLKDNEGKNKVVAVIEIGYYVKDIDPQISTHKTKEKIEKPGELDIYLDNCVQTYERLFKQYKEKKIDSLLKECDESSKDDYIKYFQDILEATRSLISAEFGFIKLATINKIFWNTLSIITDEEKSKLEEILTRCLEQDGNSNAGLGTNKSKFEQEVREFIDIKSIQMTDIYTQGVKIGSLFMFSKNKNHFNEIVNLILEEISTNIGPTYAEKKFHYAVSSLITPDTTITDLELNLRPLIDALKNYFETPYISIWLKESKDNKEYYLQSYASNELKLGCETFNNIIPIDQIELENDYIPIKLNSGDSDVKNSLFDGFGRRNNVKILLRTPLKTQHQIFGFIHIYLNKNIHYFDFKDKKAFLNYEDKNFLDLIAIKALITIQIHRLVNAFRDVSLALTQNDLKKTLKTITNSAMNLLNADPVILFKSDNGTDVFCNEVTFSYKTDFKENGIIKLFEIKKDTHVEFAEQIIKGKSKFFKNKSEYQEYILENPKFHDEKNFEKDFWDREEIQSLGAVRLVHRTKIDEKPVGVMFINFRKKVNLDDDEIIGLIKTFADFAATAIHNAFLIETNKKLWDIRRRDGLALSVNEIVSGIAHDSGNLVSTMNLAFTRFDDFLNKKYKDKTHIEKNVVIDELTSQIKEPLDELNADFMRLRRYRKFGDKFEAKPNKIISLVKESLKLLHHRFEKQGIKVETKSMTQDAQVTCDSNQIQHLFLNLFINAIDAIGNRGTLWLGTEIKDGFIIVRVTDDGKGIPYELFKEIFQPFFTTKTQPDETGTGLGLPISKYIAETHGGHIEFKRNSDLKGVINKGMSFFVYLPIDKENKK